MRPSNINEVPQPAFEEYSSKVRPLFARRKYPSLRKLLWIVGSCFAFCVAALLICFPGRQLALACTLATGFGVSSLQTRIDHLEDKAIKNQEFSLSDRRFLLDLYSCFAKGGALVAPQSSKMMRRYLSKTGEPLAVSPDLFKRSTPVRGAMDELRKKVLEELDGAQGVRDSYSSGTFYMGDPEYFDALVGLYYGSISVRPRKVKRDLLVLSWRAEVPWTWPTYSELFEKYGDYHAQSFPLPNARSVIQSSKFCLRVDDGLGGHLSAVGIAKPFLVFSEWEETLPRGGRGPGQDREVNESQPPPPRTAQTPAVSGSGR